MATALASFAFATAANAGVTVLLAQGNDASFDKNTIPTFTGMSTSYWNGADQAISFVAGADTSGVTIGTSGIAAEPYGDFSIYLRA